MLKSRLPNDPGQGIYPWCTHSGYPRSGIYQELIITVTYETKTEVVPVGVLYTMGDTGELPCP